MMEKARNDPKLYYKKEKDAEDAYFIAKKVPHLFYRMKCIGIRRILVRF